MSISIIGKSSRGTRAPGRTARDISGSLLICIAGVALVFSAAMKFAGVPGIVRPLAALGFAGHKLLLIASLEFLAACLFLWPRTRSVGLLLVSAYLGGAICAHVQTGDYAHALPSSLLLAIAWTGARLRHPRLPAA